MFSSRPFVLLALFSLAAVAKEPDDDIVPQPDSAGGLKLRLICGNQATDAKLARLKDFPDLQTVEAFGTDGFSDAGLANIAALPRLRSLSLGGFHLTVVGFGTLRGKTSLTSLAIIGKPLTVELAEIIASLPNLQKLRLRPSTIEPGVWKPLSQLTNLRELDFADTASDSSNEHLAGLENCSQLEKITLFSQKFGPQCIARLKGNKRLRELNLMKVLVNSETAADIAQFTELKSLNIHYAAATPEAVAVLAKIPSLRHLGIYGNEMRSHDLPAFKSFKHLLTLDIWSENITEADTHELRNAQHNTIVNRHNYKHNLADLAAISKHADKNEAGEVISVTMLCHEPATDAKVGILHQFPAIEELMLAGKDLTDYGLLELRTLKKLRVVDVNSAAVTDEGILHLQEIPSLTEIHLITPNVTPAGIAKLKGLLLNVQISTEH